MGTDVHCIGQIKVDGAWVDHEFVHAPDMRHYDLFAIMADVRNGYGFGGCDTGDAVEPINVPKGIPSDMSDEYKENIEFGHSHSWLTAKEIFDYKERHADAKQVFRGVVSVRGYKEFLETGQPSAWSGGVSGDRIRQVSNEEMQKMIDSGDSEFDYYTTVEWSESLMDNLEYFFVDLLNEMIVSLQGDTNLEHARIVFFFDS